MPKLATIPTDTQCQPCKSSLISQHGYNPTTKQMTIVFAKRGDVWQYNNVSPDTYSALCAAPSIGAEFLRIKPTLET